MKLSLTLKEAIVRAHILMVEKESPNYNQFNEALNVLQTIYGADANVMAEIIPEAIGNKSAEEFLKRIKD